MLAKNLHFMSLLYELFLLSIHYFSKDLTNGNLIVEKCIVIINFRH